MHKPRAFWCVLFPAWWLFERWSGTQQSHWHGTLRLGHVSEFPPISQGESGRARRVDGWVDKAHHPHTICCQNNAHTQSLTHTNTQLPNLRMTLILCLKILAALTAPSHQHTLGDAKVHLPTFFFILFYLCFKVNTLEADRTSRVEILSGRLVALMWGHLLFNMSDVVTLSLHNRR